MQNINKTLMCWYVAIIAVFAMTTPITGLITGVLLISQNYNSLIAEMLGIFIGVILAYYAPIIFNYFKAILNLLLNNHKGKA